MNKINRSLVKSQAKQIIKEKIFALFVLSAIVLFLVNGLTVGISAYNSRDNLEDIFGPSNGSSDNSSGQNTPEDFFNYFGNGDYDNYDDGNDSGDSSSDNPIESFGQKYTPSDKIIGSSVKPSIMLVNGNIGLEDIGLKSLTVVSVILSPLFVSLCGFYVLLIKRDPNEQLGLGKEIQNIFKISFGPTYGNKIVIYILRGVFEFLWSLLFVIPGIVYHYSSYFAFQLMCENPNLKPTEALKLSKKMVAGNRGELFAPDLSFIGWWILTGITFGIASIYVIPYYFTTQALYYENFKLRALQEGKITEDDFLSQEQRAAKYAFAGAQNGNQNYNDNNNQSNYYYNPNKAVLKTKLHKIKMQLRFIPTIQTVYRQSKSLFKAVHIRLMRILTIQQPQATAHQARRQTARLMNIIILPFNRLRQMAKFLRLKFRITKTSNSH